MPHITAAFRVHQSVALFEPRRFFCSISLGFLALLMAGCGSLPPLEDRTLSSALTDTQSTALGKAAAPLVAAHPGNSGIHPLLDPLDAFAARMLLARTAERSLDVQYYIWRQDTTGTMLFQALRAAADRGVRVRLLLDDNNTYGLDPVLAALHQHPNIEVRLFNPFVFRGSRLVGFLTDFSRANRRMHNKTFTADNQVTIIGGRNIGDEYFGATDRTHFVDLDVVAVGSVVNDVSEDFDRYWRSGSSYPVDGLLPPATSAQLDELAAAAAAIEQAPAARGYVDAVRQSAFVTGLMCADLPLEWAPARMLSDDPAKGLDLAPPAALLPSMLAKTMGDAKSEIDIVSPYFVPTDAGVEGLSALAARQVKVRVLTNSLAATDVTAVHSGYAKHRKALLKAGIELYELRSSAQQREKSKASIFGGSSASSLHAKTFSVDRSRAFVGSFNFDPRSAKLNTELGFVIESPALASSMADVFVNTVPEIAYRVQLTDGGQLRWVERRNGETLTHDSEPGAGLLQRTWVGLLSILPIEWLL